jgi:hypothetical protein
MGPQPYGQVIIGYGTDPQTDTRNPVFRRWVPPTRPGLAGLATAFAVVLAEEVKLAGAGAPASTTNGRRRGRGRR